MTIYIYPVTPHPISDSFADHVARGSVNPGVDFDVPTGTLVHSVASGIVTVTDNSPEGAGGKMIHVNHDDGSGADYLHLSGISVGVGQKVAQGALLGYSGNTGTETTGDHLHFSFRRNWSQWFGDVGNLDFVAIINKQVAPAVSGTATPIKKRKKTVNFYQDTSGTIWYGAYPIPGLKDGIHGPERYAVLVRYDQSNSSHLDQFNPVQTGWIREALAANGIKL